VEFKFPELLPEEITTLEADDWCRHVLPDPYQEWFQHPRYGRLQWDRVGAWKAVLPGPAVRPGDLGSFASVLAAAAALKAAASR
jgi:hypothetical protein